MHIFRRHRAGIHIVIAKIIALSKKKKEKRKKNGMECINGKEKAKALKFSINIYSHNIYNLLHHLSCKNKQGRSEARRRQQQQSTK
jgi:hypothetical protein